MSVVVYYCERCGRRIEIDEIEQGFVATATNGYYCQECAKELGVPIIAEERQKSATTANNSKRESKITTYKIRKEAVDEYELYGLDKKVAAPHKRRPPRKKSSPLPIALGVLGIVVVIVVLAVAVSGGSAKRTGSKRTGSSRSRTSKRVHRAPTLPKPPENLTPKEPRHPVVPEWKVKLKEILQLWDRNKDKLEAYPEICKRLRDLLNTPRLSPDASYQIQNYYDNAWVEWRSVSNRFYKDLRTKEAQCSELKEKLSVWEGDIPPETHPEVKEAIEQRRQVIKNALSVLGDFDDIKRRAKETLQKDSEKVSELGGIIIDLEMLASEVEDWIDDAREDDPDEPEMKGRAELLASYIDEAKELKERLRRRAEKLRKKRDELQKTAAKKPKPPDNRRNPPQQNQPPWADWDAFKQRYGHIWKERIAPNNAPELTVGQFPQQIPLVIFGAIQRQGNTHTAAQNGVGWIFFGFRNAYEFRDYTATFKMKIVNLGGGVALLPRALLLHSNRFGQLSGYGQDIPFPQQAVGREFTIKVTVSGQDVTIIVGNGAPQSLKLRDPSLPMSQKPNPPAGVPMLQLRDGASIQILGASFKLNAIK